MFDRFTDDARRAVVVAQEEARLDGSAEIAPRHVALGGLAQDPVVALLGDHCLTLDGKLRRALGGAQHDGHIPFSDSTRFALEQSLRLSMQFDHQGITSVHVLLGALTCGDADVEEAVRLAEFDLAALINTLRDLPSTPPDDLTVAQLRRYLSVDAGDRSVRQRFEVQLVEALIREGELEEARRSALDFLAAGNASVAPQLIVIGEFTGDVALIVAHAEVALDAVDSMPAYRATYGLALAHAGRFDESRREIAAAGESAEGVALVGVMLEAAECELLADEVGAAAELVSQIDEPDPAELPLLRMVWMRLRLDVARAQGETVDIGSPPFEMPTINDRFYRTSLAIAQIHGALEHSKPNVIARKAGGLAADADRLGFNGLAAEARAVRGEALRLAGKRKWQREIAQAANEFEALGRVVVAERLRAASAAS